MEDEIILEEAHRAKLDGIVSEMQSNNETDENIQWVVDDFKKKYGKPSPNTETSKGVIAEGENGELESPSADTTSSSDSEQNKTNLLKEVDSRAKYPELMNERDSIVNQLESSPVMETGDLNTRLEEIDSIINSEPKSFRKSREERAEELDALISEQEQKDYAIGANGASLQDNGTYEALIEERKLVQQDIDNENKLLGKITTDTTITDQFIRFFTPKFLEKYITPDNEKVELSKEVEEKLLQKLDSNPDLKSKVGFGSEDRTFISLEEREKLIKESKAEVLQEQSESIKKEYNVIVETAKGLDREKDAKQLHELDKQIQKLNERNDELLFTSGYDKVNEKFNDVFKRTTKSKEYDESLGQGGLDATSTFVEGMVNTVLDGTVGFAGFLGSLGDVTSKDEDYSVFDAVGDTAYELSNNNLLPSSKSEEGRLVDVDGNWNLSAYSIGKAGAEGLPFTISLLNDARKGDVRGVYKKLGKVISPKKAEGLAQSLQMAEKAYKLTVSDNRKEAIDNGLNGAQAIAYSNMQSMATGLTQMIMPDTKFFKTPAGKAVIGKLTNDLKGAVTKEAIKKAAGSFFLNLGKEIGEEELEGAISEVIKFGMLQNQSSEFFTAKYQKELIGNTLVVSGALGGAGFKSNVDATKTKLYKDIDTHYEGLISDIDGMIEGSTDEKFVGMMNDSKKLIGNVKEAITKSPKTVSGKQIDLMIEKKELIQEMKTMDEAYHPEYKEKIEKLNENIRKESSLKPEPSEDSGKTETKAKQGENKTEGTEEVTNTVKTDESNKEIKKESQEVTTEPSTEEKGGDQSTNGDVQYSVEEDLSIAPTLAAVRSMVSVSDKKQALSDIKSKLKSLTSSGILTKAQSKSLINRALGVDATNKQQVDNFIEYFGKQMGKATSRNIKNVVKSTKKKAKKNSRTKSKLTPLGLKNVAREASSINEKYLTDEQLAEYNSVLEEVNASFLSVTNKNYKPASQDKISDKIDKLKQEAEKAQTKAYLEEVGGEGEALSEQLWRNDEEFEVLVDGMQKDKAEKLKQKLIGMASVRSGQLRGDLGRNTLLKNIDFNNYSSTFLKKYIKVADNIVENNDDSGTYDLVSEIRKTKDAQWFMGKVPKENVTNLVFDPINTVRGVTMMFKTIFGKADLAAKFNKASGLASISKNNQLMLNEVSKVEDRYTKVLKVVKRKNKKIESPENTLLRGVAGQLIQGGTNEDFNINKSRIEQHIERMNEYGAEDSKALTKALEEVYAEFKDFKSQEEIKNYLTDKNDGNMELINFWLKTFDGVKGRLKDNTEYVHGERMGDFIENYLPIKTKYDGSGDTSYEDIERSRPSFMQGGIVNPSPASATKSRTKAPKLPSTRILDLDFDNVMFNRLSKSLEDIYLSKDKKDIGNFFKTLNKEKYFKAETRKILDNKINEMLDVYSNKPMMRTETELFVKDAENVIRKMSVRLALATITQYPKQYISVAMGSMIRLGKNSDLLMKEMFTSKKDIPLLDMYSIASRGESQGGTKLTGDRISETKNGAYSKFAKSVGKKLKGIDETIDKAIFFSLRTGDVNIAKSTWIAFYKAHLRKNGVDLSTVDMKTEHEKIDSDNIRQEAASYAETMVEDTQISSDGARGSSFFNSNKNMATTIIRSIMMPYQRFNVNGKVRMVTDVGNIIKGKKLGDKDMVKEATVSLGATIAEQATFHAMKIYLLSGILGMGKDAIASMLGFEPEDEDDETKEANAKFRDKKFLSALVKDLNPMAVGTLLEDLTLEGWNWLAYLADEEDESFDYFEWEKNKMKENDLPLYRYGNSAGFGSEIGYGLYSAPFSKMMEIKNDFKYAFQEEPKVRNNWGGLDQFDFDDDQKDLMKIMFLADLTSLFGMEMETIRALQKVQREQLKEAKINKKKKRK